MMEEAEAKLSAESIRKKEAKERARQMKKGMPKVKMTRANQLTSLDKCIMNLKLFLYLPLFFRKFTQFSSEKFWLCTLIAMDFICFI